MQNFVKEGICSLNAHVQKRQLQQEKLEPRNSEWQLLENKIGTLREVVDFSEKHLKELAIYQEWETAIWNNFKN